MSDTVSTGLGPPPLQTPITAESGDQFGIPFLSRQDNPASGNLHVGWAAWFSQLWQRIFGNSPAVQDLTLTAASTTVNPPASNTAADLVVILRQDATGGRAVVWGAGFSLASTNIDTTASTASVFRFVYSTAVGLWVMVGQPTTGMV